MGVTERRTREKEELRKKILNAATELFIHEGVDNVSIRGIAEKIEYSPTTIYLYFKDKAELIGAICSELFAGLNSELDRIAALGLSPLETLRASLIRYVEFGLENPNLYLVIFCVPDTVKMYVPNGDPELDPGLCSFEKLRQGIWGCMSTGAIHPGDVESCSQSVFMMTHGVTSALLTMTNFPWLDKSQLIPAAIDRILVGLGAEVVSKA